MLGPITTSVAAFGPFFEHIRPSKSPYLITTMFCVAGLTLLGTSEIQIPDFKKWSFVIPLFICLFSLFFLSLKFKPYKEEMNEEELSDLDSQFKFSRSLGISVAVVLLYFISVQEQNIDLKIWIFMYICVIIYFATFKLYMIFRNIREESASNQSIFQIAFMTAAFLTGACLLSPQIILSDGSIFYDCQYTVSFINKSAITADNDGNVTSNIAGYEYKNAEEKEYSEQYGEISNFKASDIEKRLSFSLIIFLFLLFIWSLYQIFWLKRLLSIARISVTVVG